MVEGDVEKCVSRKAGSPFLTCRCAFGDGAAGFNQGKRDRSNRIDRGPDWLFVLCSVFVRARAGGGFHVLDGTEAQAEIIETLDGR